jgi:hypothetical protein
MAAGMLGKPGSTAGPCKGKCKHRDCAETRRMLASVCPFCNKAIGPDTPFYRARLSEDLAHERCMESAVTRNDARLGLF